MASMGWPKLSESLPRDWGQLFGQTWGMCESCGAEGGLFEELEVWQEHDDGDHPTPVAVVLCSTCAEAIVPPHPRLYGRQRRHVPLPGVTELCVGCKHRDVYRCRHPDLTVNGGPGLKMTHPEPARVHLNYGRGRGEWMWHWTGPPTECAGREEREPPTP